MSDTLILWDWQESAVQKLRDLIDDGVKNIVLSAPTGAGKTVLATHMIQRARKKHRRSLFVADRIPLIDQTSRKFDQYGIPHGIIQADHWRKRPYERVQVASAQTLARRRWPEADVIFVDECHTSFTTVINRIKERDTTTIGLTATPFTKGLGKYYDAVVSVTTTHKLINDGFLAPYRIYAASQPDMAGAKIVAGEWTDEEAANRSMSVVGDCVAEYLKHGNGKKAICFGVNVAHCAELQRQFMAAGVQAALYTYKTGDVERARLLEEYSKPNSYIRVLISVSALAKGFDQPDVEVVIIARPLRKSLAEYIQMFGRGLRRHPGKDLCTVLDHSGNWERLGEDMMDFFEFGVTELDDGKPKTKKKKQDGGDLKIRKCFKCSHVHLWRPTCPACGFEYPQRKSQVKHIQGTLAEITANASRKEERQRFYSELIAIAYEKKYSGRWVHSMFKTRFGVSTSKLNLETKMIAPREKTRNWVKSQLIKYWKGKKAS